MEDKFINLFKKEAHKKIPATYLLIEDLGEVSLSRKGLHVFVHSTHFNTNRYLLGTFHRPISKIITYEKE